MMNAIVKSALRASTFRSLQTPLRATFGKREFTRTLWHMSKANFDNKSSNGIHKPSFVCSCGCGIQRLHTKGILIFTFKLLVFK